MRIPQQIKIGGFNYIVERPNGAFLSNGAAFDGEHSFADRTIKVSTNGCPDYQDLVFLHEVCHAIVAHYTPQLEQDEAFVEQFSKGLYQVLVDNPTIMECGGANNE